jgi:galactokinase
LTLNALHNIRRDHDLLIQSPGRINLIGEHIDYNGGHVLPAAIDRHIVLYFKKNSSKQFNFYSENLDRSFSTNLSDLLPRTTLWENFVLGIIEQFVAMGLAPTEGFDCYIRSKIPIGAGISSSAALLCGLAKGINELFSLAASDLELILLAQRAEHKYVGTHCGVMDHFAVIKGVPNGLLFLNCQTLNYEIVPANFHPYEIVLLNTNVSHSLESSEYNSRRTECEQALSLINKSNPLYSFLADVPISTLSKHKDSMDPILYKRAKYVLEENSRVLKSVECIREHKLEAFGELLYECHDGLQKLYEVSCTELDFLVAFAKTRKYVAGARMMGGGFGGCTINLVLKEHSGAFIKEISAAYSDAFQITLTPLLVNIGSGATRL